MDRTQASPGSANPGRACGRSLVLGGGTWCWPRPLSGPGPLPLGLRLLCDSPFSSVTGRPQLSGRSHRHVCESTLRRKGSEQNKKRCLVLPISRDERVNKKESPRPTPRTGKPQVLMKLRGAGTEGGRTGNGGSCWEGNLEVPHGLKAVLFDPDIPLLGITMDVIATAHEDVCTKLFVI